MKSFLRLFLLIPKPKITKDEALKIANEHYMARGKIWNPEIIEGLRTWTVLNPKATKGAARIIVDQQTGKVISFSSISR